MDDDIGIFMIKAIGHDCSDNKHKALIVRDNNDVYETAIATSEQIEDFVYKKADKYIVPVFYTESCREFPDLKAKMGKQVQFDDL